MAEGKLVTSPQVGVIYVVTVSFNNFQFLFRSDQRNYFQLSCLLVVSFCVYIDFVSWLVARFLL